MNIIIIEDELTAADKLHKMLLDAYPAANILAHLASVKKTIDWLDQNIAPDLAFVDIQLSDDTSFEIFKQRNITFPVIFTTAYDDYILQSFEYNTIDYLLKPIQKDRLNKALQKVKSMEAHFVGSKFTHLYEHLQTQQTKQRYLVKKGTGFVSVPVRDIAYFFTEHKVVFLKDRNGVKYILDKTLSELHDELDSQYFFRANRKYIIHIDVIQEFKSENGKICLKLSPHPNEEVIVSKENAPNFRTWVGK